MTISSAVRPDGKVSVAVRMKGGRFSMVLHDGPYWFCNCGCQFFCFSVEMDSWHCPNCGEHQVFP